MAREPREGGRDRRQRGSEDRDSEDGIIEKMVSINRVAKVVKGGRRFAFAALVVVGDAKGRVGYGSGKAREVPEAIRKATDQAKRKMIRVAMREGRTLHHDANGHYGSGRVVLRAVFETMGVQDVVAKCIGTSNPHNMIKAAFDALEGITSPRSIAAKRNKKVGDIVGRRDGAAAAAAIGKE